MEKLLKFKEYFYSAYITSTMPSCVLVIITTKQLYIQNLIAICN